MYEVSHPIHIMLYLVLGILGLKVHVVWHICKMGGGGVLK